MAFDPNAANFMAGQFVNFYFKTLYTAPATVLACYNEESTLQRFERAPVIGRENIKSELEIFPFDRPTIHQYDVVDQSENSLTIRVHLTTQLKGQAPREAVQTFHVVFKSPSADLGPSTLHIAADKLEDAQGSFDNSCQLARLSISNVEVPQTSDNPTSEPSSSFSQPTVERDTYRCIAYKEY
ncbi:unnamed protein product [Bursaphelenchus xylophilus]|uniref:(pine wood nematode) hypothetical protein n=1 Tax=Bursaphelenchus xylophilus TaxID=6326 RepID=A0A1I7RUJ1_BURXY|nr:unnamed protein product [Bursaphelenchus xylophilus]CAG9114163.1 unnamed protein product [Bursaphelenchus xylophilus]